MRIKISYWQIIVYGLVAFITFIIIYNVCRRNIKISLDTSLVDTNSVYIDKLVEREERIKNMEKTLIIHYDLSWHESHYYSIIYDDFAQKYGVPWQIFPAIIRIESNFKPNVTSNKGAKGLSQVMPKTGEEVANKLGIRFDNKTTLWNDILNMVLGFTYLCEGIQQCGLEDGVQRYIGGPGFNKGHKDVGKYRTNVRREFIRLIYIYNGVLNKGVIADPFNIFDDSTDRVDTVKGD